MRNAAVTLIAMTAAAADQSALRPASPEAGEIRWLWDVMLWTTGIIYVVVMLILLVGAWRRKHATERSAMPDARLDKYVFGAVALSTLVLFGLLVASVAVGKVASSEAHNGITINITGYQWWWRAEYLHPEPQQNFTTANEFHVPVGRPVTFVLNSADVIHSFWPPNLQGKRDLIPGQKNSLILHPDKPGAYRGQCAEFCGLQHAHMSFVIYAEPQEKFDAWYANQVKPAHEPDTEERRKGLGVFLSHACVMCHTIRGTPAGARLGPDLTHLKSRSTIAAATLPNDRGHLGGWISNPHSIKQGVRMPANPLAPDELNSLLGYLESLQ
jgi:cytochrome c oxidase subunit 2